MTHSIAKVIGLDGDGVTIECACGLTASGTDRDDAFLRHEADVCRVSARPGLERARAALAEKRGDRR